jgi:hypothetical protein
MVQWSVSQVMVGTTRVRFPQVADLISVKVRVRDRVIGQKIALKSAVVTRVTTADLRRKNRHFNQSKNHFEIRRCHTCDIGGFETEKSTIDSVENSLSNPPLSHV